MPDFTGTGSWSFDKGENMAALMQALQVPADKIPKDTSSNIEITQSGNDISIKTVTAAGTTRELNFTIGTPFVDAELTALRGSDVTVTPSLDGGKLVLTGAQGNKVTREVVGGQLVQSFDFGGICGKRIFNKA